MDGEPHALIRLSAEDIKPAARMLARAFRDYPLLAHAVPDPAERDKAAYHFCEFDLYYGIRYGEVYATSPRMEGVAAWIPSEHFPMPMHKILRAVPFSVMTVLGRLGGSRLMRPSRHIDSRHKALVPCRHWFLALLGVAPESQGKGHVSALLLPVLASIDAQRLPCFVETMDARNVPRYEHYGFRVLEQSRVPGTDLTSWAMLRESPPNPL